MGTRLAVVSTIGIWIYDVQTCKPLDLLIGHTGPVNSIVFSPDGGTFATASDDNTARLWDTITSEHKASFVGHTGAINSVAFSPDGERLATASDDKTIGLWNLHTGEQIARLEGHTEKVYSAVFSPDGTVIASSEAWGNVNGIRIWDSCTGEFLKIFDEDTDWIEYIVYSPDGSMLISRETSTYMNFWDADTGKNLKTRAIADRMGKSTPVTFSPDRRTFATGIRNGDVCLWDVDTGKLLKTFELEAHAILPPFSHLVDLSPSSAAFSPDGETIACASEDGTIRFWEVNTGKISKVITEHTPHLSSTQKTEGTRPPSQRTFSVMYSPDGNTLATGYGAEIHFRNPGTGEILTTITGIREPIRSITYSSDGGILATGDDTAKVRLWDTQTGRFLGTFAGHKKNVSSVAFSPDGRMLASGSHDNTICLWEVRIGELYLIGEQLRTTCRTYRCSIFRSVFTRRHDTCKWKS